MVTELDKAPATSKLELECRQSPVVNAGLSFFLLHDALKKAAKESCCIARSHGLGSPYIIDCNDGCSKQFLELTLMYIYRLRIQGLILGRQHAIFLASFGSNVRGHDGG